MSGFTFLADIAAATFKFSSKSLGELLFPTHCARCRQAIPSGHILCRICRSNVVPITPPFCFCCSEPFPGGSPSFTCASCTERRFSFLCAVSAYRFRGTVRDVIHRIKYHSDYGLRTQAGRWLVRTLRDPRIKNPPPDLLIPVPLHFLRQRERGFNQAEAIAKWVGHRCHIPCKHVLVRIKNTATQTGFDRRKRISNLRGAFILRHNRDVLAKHCVLVDDVFTTGSTLNACARVLRAAGAASIRCITVARG